MDNTITLKIYGQHDDATIQQLERCVTAEAGAIGVLCADGHKGYSMPIGGVVAYRNYVSPSGVGYDIACGNMAVQTNLMASDVPPADYARLADEIQRRVSFGVGRKNAEPVDSPVFAQIAQSPVAFQRSLLGMAQTQLGTVGSGNHYVDVLEDEAGVLWIGVHFGSRGFGHKTATGFMNIAQGRKWDEGKGEGEMDSPPLLLDIHQPSGADYIAAMQIAGAYAYAGREAVSRRCWRFWAGTRRGASITITTSRGRKHTAATRSGWSARARRQRFPISGAFVGGSMGDISVILRGVESEASKGLLYSTVHGAGRVMSRTQAAGKQKWHKVWACLDHRNCDGAAPIQTPKGADGSNPKCPKCGHKTQKKTWMERLKTGLVDFDAERAKLTERGIVLRGAGADEAPPVYRPLRSVLDAHAGTIDVVHTLTPRIVVMAGGDEFDPMSLHRLNAKRDGTERRIIQALRKVGVQVFPISGRGLAGSAVVSSRAVVGAGGQSLEEEPPHRRAVEHARDGTHSRSFARSKKHSPCFRWAPDAGPGERTSRGDI
jgi:tRNA-splicing ligase RtcB